MYILALLISPALPEPGLPPSCNEPHCTVSAGQGLQQELRSRSL